MDEVLEHLDLLLCESNEGLLAQSEARTQGGQQAELGVEHGLSQHAEILWVHGGRWAHCRALYEKYPPRGMGGNNLWFNLDETPYWLEQSQKIVGSVGGEHRRVAATM